MTAEALRFLLLLYIFAAFALSLAYLRRRRMGLRAFALWGTFALLLPVLGPFLLIAFQPGKPAHTGQGHPRDMKL